MSASHYFGRVSQNIESREILIGDKILAGIAITTDDQIAIGLKDTPSQRYPDAFFLSRKNLEDVELLAILLTVPAVLEKLQGEYALERYLGHISRDADLTKALTAVGIDLNAFGAAPAKGRPAGHPAGQRQAQAHPEGMA